MFHVSGSWEYVPCICVMRVCSMYLGYESKFHVSGSWEYVPCIWFMRVCSTYLGHESMFHVSGSWEYVPCIWVMRVCAIYRGHESMFHVSGMICLKMQSHRHPSTDICESTDNQNIADFIKYTIFHHQLQHLLLMFNLNSFNYLRQGGCVMPSICLSVCQQLQVKTTEWSPCFTSASWKSYHRGIYRRGRTD